MREVIGELKKFNDSMILLNPPVKYEDVEEFESKIALLLPKDYKRLIVEHNGFLLVGTEVFGIYKPHSTDSLNSVYEFEHERNMYPMPVYFVPFSPDGAGGHYYFDLSNMSEDSCNIIFWQPGYEYTANDTPEITHSSFIDWAKEVVIEWTLTDYDYHGK